jgi:hypothetical protein
VVGSICFSIVYFASILPIRLAGQSVIGGFLRHSVPYSVLWSSAASIRLFQQTTACDERRRDEIKFSFLNEEIRGDLAVSSCAPALRRTETCNVAELSGSFSETFRRKCGRLRIDQQGHESIRSIRRRPPAKDCDMSVGNVAKRSARSGPFRFPTLPLPLEPLTVRIPVAVQLTGIGRSKIYELIAAGKLDTVKVGASTLVTVASLRRLVQRQQN